MGQFNQDDEDQLNEQTAPAEDAAPERQAMYAPNADIASLKDAQPQDPKQAVYDSIKAKYADMFAQGQKDTKAAQDKASRNNMIAGLIDSGGKLFTAKDRARAPTAKWDSSYLDNVRAANKQTVDQTQQTAQQGLDNLLKQDQMGWQDEQRGQARKDWGRKDTTNAQADAKFDQEKKGWDRANEDDSPTSDASNAMRSAYARMFPDMAKMDGFENLSASDLKQHMFEPLKLKETIEAQKAEAAARLAQTGQLHEDNMQLHRDVMGVKSAEAQKKDVEKYQKTIDPLVKNMSTMSDVEKTLGFNLDSYDPKTNSAEFKDKDGKPIRKEVDLPGSEIPMMGYQPTATIDGDERHAGRDLASSVASLYNSKLHENYGARQTDQEVGRLEKEFGQGGFATKQDYLNGLKRYKAGMQRMHGAVSAGFDKDTVGAYNKGLPPEISQYTGGVAPAPTSTPAMAPAAQAALAQASQILADPEAPPEVKAKAQAVVDKLKPSN